MHYSDQYATHLIVQKDEVHLDEDEGHPSGGRECQQHVVAVGVPLQLPVLAELQPGVYHRTDAERWNNCNKYCLRKRW